MSTAAPDFLAIEIDALDDKLAETAMRKRIPSLNLQRPEASTDLNEGTSDDRSVQQPDRPKDPRPTRRPEQTSRRRPLSLEVPDYLARELKVKAASDAVTVRFLVLSALAEAGYRIDQDELEEDGRRLR